MKIEKNNMRGITLIALIVTIIVLLILAAISITMLTGQNSILNRASEAKNKTGVSQEEETVKLSISDALTQGLGTISTENLQNALRNNGLNGPLTGDGPWTYTGEYKKYNIEKSGSVTSKEQNSASSDKIVKALGDYGVTEDNRLLKLEKEEKALISPGDGWYKGTKGEYVDEVGEVKKICEAYDDEYYIVNTNGEVFDIENEENENTIKKIDGLNNIDEVFTLFGYINFAKTKNGEIYAWGGNYSGQLGIGNTENQTTPTKINGLSNIEQIYIMDNYCLAKNKNGEVYAWGGNYSGQLGIGNTENQTTPTKINELTNIEEIYIGSSSVFAKNKNGEVYAWGENENGQLGIGNTENQTTPTKINGLSNIERIYIKDDSTFAKTKNGEVYAWGGNDAGQLGIGNNEYQDLPMKINELTNIEEIYTGYCKQFAKNKNGEIYYWGYNQYTPLKIDGISGISGISYTSEAIAITNDYRIYDICSRSNGVPELIKSQLSSIKEADEIVDKMEIEENRECQYACFYTNKNNIYYFVLGKAM